MTDIFTNSPATLDFEEGTLADYDGTATSGTGANSAVSSPVYAGSYAHQASITSGASGDYAWGYKNITWPAGNVAYCRTFLRITAKGTHNSNSAARIFGFYSSGPAVECVLHLNPYSGAMRLYCKDGGGIRDTSLTFSASLDTWYEIEIKLDRSGANIACELFKDGSSLGTWSGTGKGTQPNAVYGAIAAYASNVNNYATIVFDNTQAEDARIGGGAAGLSIPVAMRHYRNLRT
jgi:hypothetical protein